MQYGQGWGAPAQETDASVDDGDAPPQPEQREHRDAGAPQDHPGASTQAPGYVCRADRGEPVPSVRVELFISNHCEALALPLRRE